MAGKMTMVCDCLLKMQERKDRIPKDGGRIRNGGFPWSIYLCNHPSPHRMSAADVDKLVFDGEKPFSSPQAFEKLTRYMAREGRILHFDDCKDRLKDMKTCHGFRICKEIKEGWRNFEERRVVCGTKDCPKCLKTIYNLAPCAACHRLIFPSQRCPCGATRMTKKLREESKKNMSGMKESNVAVYRRRLKNVREAAMHLASDVGQPVILIVPDHNKQDSQCYVVTAPEQRATKLLLMRSGALQMMPPSSKDVEASFDKRAAEADYGEDEEDFKTATQLMNRSAQTMYNQKMLTTCHIKESRILPHWELPQTFDMLISEKTHPSELEAWNTAQEVRINPVANAQKPWITKREHRQMGKTMLDKELPDWNELPWVDCADFARQSKVKKRKRDDQVPPPPTGPGPMHQ